MTRDMGSEAADEIERLRGFVEWMATSLWEGGCPDGFDVQDKLEELGLIVEGEPTPEFIDEWGEGVKMFVLAWSRR